MKSSHVVSGEFNDSRKTVYFSVTWILNNGTLKCWKPSSADASWPQSCETGSTARVIRVGKFFLFFWSVSLHLHSWLYDVQYLIQTSTGRSLAFTSLSATASILALALSTPRSRHTIKLQLCCVCWGCFNSIRFATNCFQ